MAIALEPSNIDAYRYKETAREKRGSLILSPKYMKKFEPVDPKSSPSDILGPDDYDEAQVMTLVRMWSGFDSETITDEQLLASLELDDNYPDADIPDWVMTDLGVLAAKGDVTVNEFVVALQYVLEYT